MRFFLACFCLAVIGIIQLPYRLVILLTKKRDPKKAAHKSWAFCRRVGKAVMWTTGVKPTIYGRENLNAEWPVVYIGNHRSIFDIVLLYVLSTDTTGFVAKKELEKVPVLAWWMKEAHSLFLDRENLREGLKTILQGVEYVNSGESMGIFPEGTRNKEKDLSAMLEFHAGSFKLATKAGVPIVPIVFYNTADIFEDHKPWLKKARVIIRIGEPIRQEDLTADQKKFLSDHVRGIMQEMLNLCAEEAS